MFSWLYFLAFNCNTLIFLFFFKGLYFMKVNVSVKPIVQLHATVVEFYLHIFI